MKIMMRETEDLDCNIELVRKGITSLINKPAFGKYFLAYNADAPETYMGMIMITYEVNFEIGGMI